MPNAIERLRDSIPVTHSTQWSGEEDNGYPTCPCVDCGERMSLLVDADAVDALYQAAKRAEDAMARLDSGLETNSHKGTPDWFVNAERALAAAVTRVEKP